MKLIQKKNALIRLSIFVTAASYAILASPFHLDAQSPIVPPPLTQSFTPAALAPGTPAGSYILSGFDTVNYGNLSVNFRFPLVKIGGRGTVSAVMMPDFTVNSQWTVYPSIAGMNCPGGVCTVAGWNYSIGRSTPGGTHVPSMYGAPRMMVRQGGYPCSQGAQGSLVQNYSSNTLSRLTFIGPDGTEMEFVDQKTGGEPQPYAIGQGGFYDRGASWVTRDGTSAVFTTTGPDVFDTVATAQNCSIQPIGISGIMVTRDGTTYTFANGYAQSIADRNGNTISYTYTNSGTLLTGITDPAGRQYKVTLSTSYDLLTYPGANGAARPIKIFHSNLVPVLRKDQPQSLQSSSVLWQNVLSYTQNPQYVDGTFISQILLPDGSSYAFKYDSYGNVARVELPAGGAVEYDWVGDHYTIPGGVAAPNQNFLRCLLTQRREYLHTSDSTPSRVTTFSTGPSGPAGGVTVSDYDGTGTVLLAKTIHSVVAGPFPPSTDPIDYDPPTVGQEPSTQYYDRDGATLLRQVGRTYQERSCAGDPTCWWLTNTNVAYVTRPTHDFLPWQETTTEGNLSKKTVTLYDQYNNENSRTESDWGSGSSGGPIQRKILTTYNTGSAYTNANILNLPTEVQVLDGFGIKWADTTYGYDESPLNPAYSTVGGGYIAPSAPRGNRTTITECVGLSTCTAEATTYAYDVAGNVNSITDANSHTATLSYVDNYADGNNGRNSYAHVTQIKYPKANSSATAQAAKWQYDFGTGKPTAATDVNGVNTDYSFSSDLLDRLTQITKAAGINGVQAQTNVVYSVGGVTPVTVDVYNDQVTFADQALHTRTIYDGFGRDVEADQFVGGGSYIQVLKTYDAMGRPYTTGTPAVPGSNFSQSWLTTYYPYDGLGRIQQVTTQGDGASIATTYSSNQTTVTDQAGKQRSTWTDGLGRLVQVEEAPNSDKFFTTYGYSALDDLLCVNQGVLGAATANPSIYSCDPSKAHARSFAYDGLKRLTAATNPETGTIRYSYDPVGNLLSKTDALSVTTCFGTLSGSNCTTGYDGLNRPTVKTYSDGFTPQVNYTYDSAPYGIGRLAQVSNSASTTNYLAYDALGRIASSNQITGSTTSNFPSYQYNLAGALVSETYPSGRVIATAYDGANRPAYLKGTLGSTATPYVGSSTNWIQYWPHGVPYKAAFGNGLWRTLSSVNGHLQPTAYWDAVNDNPNQFLRIEDPNWLNGSGQNNGNLQGTTVWAGGPNQSANLPQYAESFAYDGENRLTYATDSGGWSRTFGYDQWGNMAVTLNSGVPLNVNTPTSTGLFNANNQRTGQAYFANGNLKAVQPGITLAYDAENRQTSASGYSYAYDGNGHRVTKTGGGTTTVYAYDALGQLAAEYSNAANPSHGTTYYLSYDHLGTARLITDQKANVISRHDYLPFGEEIPANTAGRNGQFGAGNDAVTQKFTGKERDSESGLDYFGARYYGSALGRWTSPDWSATPTAVPYADFKNPQSLNQYAYVLGNPLSRPDLDGHVAPNVKCQSDKQTCQAALDATVTAILSAPHRLLVFLGMADAGKTGEGSGRFSGNYTDGQKAYRTNAPRDNKNNPEPLPEAEGAHTRLQMDKKDPTRTYSGTEFDANGKAVKRVDFAGRQGDELPHEHPYNANDQSFGPKQSLSTEPPPTGEPLPTAPPVEPIPPPEMF